MGKEKILIVNGNPHLAKSIGRYYTSKQDGKTTVLFRCSSENISLAGDGNVLLYNQKDHFENCSADIFSDKVATLYTSYRFDGEVDKLKDDLKDFSSLQHLHLQLPYDINNISNLINPFSKFYKIISGLKIKEKKPTVQWNDTTMENGVAEPHIHLFNIQSGSRIFWEEVLENVFTLTSTKNHYFVFYWLSSVVTKKEKEIEKSKYEATDKLWGFSRFIRDFLVAREIALEVDISQSEEDEKMGFHINIPEPLLNGIDPSDIKKQVSGKIIESLKSVYGQHFSLVFSIEDYASLYLSGRNNRTKDNSILQDIRNNLKITIHSVLSSPHDLQAEIDDCLLKYSNQKDGTFSEYFKGLGSNELWNHFLQTTSTLTSIFLWWHEGCKCSFLLIDDQPGKIESKIKSFKQWFSDAVEEFKEVDLLLTKPIALECTVNNKNLSYYDYLIIDIEFQGENKGLELIQKLRSEIKGNGKPLLIALSRREEPEIIQRALNSGALFYVTKSNFFDLVPAIYQLHHALAKNDKTGNLGDAKIDETQQHKYAQYENWHLLSKLPLRKILELQSSWVYGKEYNIEKDDRWDDNHKYTDDYKWIQKLPKADIHCHIGSCMGPNLIPKTALLVLSEKCFYDEKFKKNLSLIIEFLLPIVSDPYLNGNTSKAQRDSGYKKELVSGWNNNNTQNIFELLESTYLLSDNHKNPEVVLLDPDDTTLERVVKDQTVVLTGKYFSRKINLRLKKVNYEEVMLVFVLMLYIRDGIKNRGGNYVNDYDLSFLKIKVVEELDLLKSLVEIDKMKEILNVFQIFWSALDDIKNIQADKCFEGFLGQNVIKYLSSAKNNKDGTTSLFSYLRGCEYGGAPHLQTKASIYLTTKFIINEYARENKIRYLELRCAVDGYSKFGLQSQNEAIEALLRGFDYFSSQASEKKNKVHINLIITAKRHKTIKEFENNVDLAFKYRNGLELKYTNNNEEDSKRNSFFHSKSKVVSFDLAGLEKGNRPSKFINQFQPLLKGCFPITIHAGEEDEAESIWEAVYLIQAQRLGHALTLRTHPDLLKFVRERHIAVELCPISNILTNGKFKFPIYKNDRPQFNGNDLQYKFDENGPNNFKIWKPNDPEYAYPLRQYLDENLDVTINTDNPFISDSSMTKEFLVAARLIGGLTKWEILRLIKNGFRSASIPKKEKRMLMNEIDDEIYELLLNEDQ